MIQRWLDLSHRALTDEVHQLVRSRDEDAVRGWAMVREHPVLAARVRGILSALERQTADYRDAAMWRVWISQARHALTPPAAPAQRTSESTPSTRVPNTDVPNTDVPNTRAPGPVEQGPAGGGTPAHPTRPPAPAPLVFREPGQ